MQETAFPMTWNDLPSIHDVEKTAQEDEQCLREIKAVLERYGKTSRFGITLLHQHFMLADDEVLVENCDIEKRTLVTTPMKTSESIVRNYIPTVWRFDGKNPSVCAYCPTHGSQHDGYKESH